MTFLGNMAKSAAVAAVLFGLCGLEAKAASRAASCSNYAHAEADRRANVGTALGGTVGGALSGALIGGLIDGGRGAGRGALIGGIGGTILGAGATNATWHRVYRDAYAGCMDRYAAEPVYDDAPEPGTRAWHRYCAARYRSFNPDTGMFLSSSGRYKPCR